MFYINIPQSDIMAIKMNIFNILCKDKRVVEVINSTNPEIEIDDEETWENLQYTHIFPFFKIPDTVEKALNYICFSVQIPRIISKNEYFKEAQFVFRAIVHESNIATKYNASRHDALASVIIDIFNWSNILGFRLELVSDTEDVLSNNYHMRTLVFKNTVLNSIKNGVPINGNR